jgi:hypothetical protein
MRTERSRTTCRSTPAILLATVTMLGAPIANAAAQPPAQTTRETQIELTQAEKLPTLHPPVAGRAEHMMEKVQRLLDGWQGGWHPFLEPSYPGGGLAVGAGYQRFVSSYNFVDVRGSYTATGYKRAEAEFVAPRLFDRRGHLSLIGGWREATQVGYFGVGTTTSIDDRTNYAFQQPYASALLTVMPTRRYLLLQGGAEYSEWKQRPGEGSYASIDTKFTPATLPGLGASPTYLHSQGTVGFDWRTSPGYTRRGGFYGVTFHDFADHDDAFGFRQVNYEVIQHLPIVRETWALSLHGRASTTQRKGSEEIPFFMLPALGGGSDLRGFDSWRFRDRNSLLLQAEWRIMASRYLDTAVFYDTGKVASRVSDLDLHGMKSDYGFGLRFHGPFATPLRIDLARSNERSFALVFSSSAAF